MYLNITNLLYDYLTEVDNSVLNESHGVLSNYLDYIYPIYEILSKSKPVFKDGKIFQYQLINYKPEVENGFVESIDINVFIYINEIPKEYSEFVYNDDGKSDLNKNLKLRKAKFNIRLPSKTPIINRSDFIEVFSHEFHHAYRYWSIIRNNNGAIPDGDFIRDTRYKNILGRMSTLDNSSDSQKILKDIMMCFYFLDSNEINAFCAEAYNFVKEHNDINLSNYTGRLNEFQGYKFLVKCVNTMYNIDKMLFDEKTQYYIEVICKDAYETLFGKTDMDESKCTIMIKQYLSQKIIKANNQFFRTIKKALCDFDRRIREEWKLGTVGIRIDDILKREQIL